MTSCITQRHKKLIQMSSMYAKHSYSKTIDGHHEFFEDKNTDAQAFVCHNGEDIIITGQGTTSLRDWSIDFQIWRTRVEYLQNTKVHAGFIQQYNAVRSQIHSAIERLLADETKICNRIVCTGHSLFGAIATIAALDCALKYELPVHCVTFGSPRVGSRDFVKLYCNAVDISYRCVRLKDPVSFTPAPIRFKHVRGGIHFGKTAEHVGAESLSLYNCVGCRVNHHSMDDYAAFALKLL